MITIEKLANHIKGSTMTDSSHAGQIESGQRPQIELALKPNEKLALRPDLSGNTTLYASRTVPTIQGSDGASLSEVTHGREIADEAIFKAQLDSLANRDALGQRVNDISPEGNPGVIQQLVNEHQHRIAEIAHTNAHANRRVLANPDFAKNEKVRADRLSVLNKLGRYAAQVLVLESLQSAIQTNRTKEGKQSTWRMPRAVRNLILGGLGGVGATIAATDVVHALAAENRSVTSPDQSSQPLNIRQLDQLLTRYFDDHPELNTLPQPPVVDLEPAELKKVLQQSGVTGGDLESTMSDMEELHREHQDELKAAALERAEVAKEIGAGAGALPEQLTSSWLHTLTDTETKKMNFTATDGKSDGSLKEIPAEQISQYIDASSDLGKKVSQIQQKFINPVRDAYRISRKIPDNQDIPMGMYLIKATGVDAKNHPIVSIQWTFNVADNDGVHNTLAIVGGDGSKQVIPNGSAWTFDAAENARWIIKDLRIGADGKVYGMNDVITWGTIDKALAAKINALKTLYTGQTAISLNPVKEGDQIFGQWDEKGTCMGFVTDLLHADGTTEPTYVPLWNSNTEQLVKAAFAGFDSDQAAAFATEIPKPQLVSNPDQNPAGKVQNDGGVEAGVDPEVAKQVENLREQYAVVTENGKRYLVDNKTGKKNEMLKDGFESSFDARGFEADKDSTWAGFKVDGFLWDVKSADGKTNYLLIGVPPQKDGPLFFFYGTVTADGATIVNGVNGAQAAQRTKEILDYIQHAPYLASEDMSRSDKVQEIQFDLADLKSPEALSAWAAGSAFSDPKIEAAMNTLFQSGILKPGNLAKVTDAYKQGKSDTLNAPVYVKAIKADTSQFTFTGK